MELVEKKEFTVVIFDPEDKIFIVHIMSFASSDNIHLFCRIQIAFLKADETSTIVFSKHSNFANVFAPELAVELSEDTGINNHTINFVDGKQPSYRQIYRLEPVELEILKTYIKTNLVNGFIRPSKSLANILILFI